MLGVADRLLRLLVDGLLRLLVDRLLRLLVDRLFRLLVDCMAIADHHSHQLASLLLLPDYLCLQFLHQGCLPLGYPLLHPGRQD